MKYNKHILFFSPGFAKDESDTNCMPSIQSFIHASSTINPDIKYSIISFQYPFESSEYSWYNIPVFAAGGKNKKYISRLITWWRVFRYFKRIHKNYPVSTIHVFWLTECLPLAWLISKLYSIHVVATIEGQDARKENRYLFFVKWIKPFIVSRSHNAANVFHESTGLTANRIIPFGLDKTNFPECSASGERTIDIIGAGSLWHLKNYNLFVEIIRELTKEFPSLKSVIAGGGVEYETLQSKIDKSGIAGNLVLLDDLPRNEVLDLMNHSKILLHTSLYEGQCYVFMEAAAFGLDLVAFDVGYIPESNKSHICKDKDQMVQVLSMLLKNKINYTPPVVISMEETVKAFTQLYK